MLGLASVGTFMLGQGSMSGWEQDRSKKIGTVPPESGWLATMERVNITDLAINMMTEQTPPVFRCE